MSTTPVPLYLRRAKGFTLLELLVVLLIVGSLTSLALLSARDTSRLSLTGEAQRLAALMALYAEQAMLDNREFGVYIDAQHIRILRYDAAQQHWTGTRHTPQQLPEGARLTLHIDGISQALPTDLKPINTEVLTPQILLLSSGEISPFSLHIQGLSQSSVEISSDGFSLPDVHEQRP